MFEKGLFFFIGCQIVFFLFLIALSIGTSSSSMEYSALGGFLTLLVPGFITVAVILTFYVIEHHGISASNKTSVI